MSAVKMETGGCVKRQGKREEAVRAGLTAAPLPGGGIEPGWNFQFAFRRGFIICPGNAPVGPASSLPLPRHPARGGGRPRRAADSTRNIRCGSMRYIKAVHIRFAEKPACDNGANETNPGDGGGQALRAGAELSAKGIFRQQPYIGNPPGRFHTRGYVQ